MNGRVDQANRALLGLTIRHPVPPTPLVIEAWIDTAFDGDLVIPQAVLDAWGALPDSFIKARMADASQATLATYICTVAWFGGEHAIQVIAGGGQFPLLGTGLLSGRRLVIDYQTGSLELL